MSPVPTADDIAHRTVRKPMTAAERRQFIRQFGMAITPVIFAYAFFTVVRDFVEDFANELWIETGFQNNAGIFAQTSTVISVFVLFIFGAFFLIKNNYQAFRLSHFLILAGILLSAVSTFCFNMHVIAPLTWMLLSVTGLYMAYLPFNCVYFERLLATYKINGNIGFVMYIADAFGYLGTVAVLLIKEFIPISYSWINFFSFLFYASSFAGFILICISLNIHSKLFNKLCNRKQPS